MDWRTVPKALLRTERSGGEMSSAHASPGAKGMGECTFCASRKQAVNKMYFYQYTSVDSSIFNVYVRLVEYFRYSEDSLL